MLSKLSRPGPYYVGSEANRRKAQRIQVLPPLHRIDGVHAVRYSQQAPDFYRI